MTLAGEVASYVPYMRRFARAVLGKQEAADQFVQSCLEQLLKERELFEVDPVRVVLFRALNDALDGGASAKPATRESATRPIGDGSILAERIKALDQRSRRLLLLTALERFSIQQAAFITRMTEEEARDLVASAKAALRQQQSTRILVIEDEPVIALDIKTTVERDGHEVVGTASTHREAVALARTHRPGLVLADIQLAENSSGLEAVQEILREVTVPVIFITAYPERLLTGRRPEPTFLITKPFDPDTLAVAIAQALATVG